MPPSPEEFSILTEVESSQDDIASTVLEWQLIGMKMSTVVIEMLHNDKQNAPCQGTLREIIAVQHPTERLNVAVSFILDVNCNYLVQNHGWLVPQTAAEMKMAGGCFCFGKSRNQSGAERTNPNIPNS